ncbi:MAG: 2-dehydropantoate 2-reductase N-terminal domain-containing protein [bacterium]
MNNHQTVNIIGAGNLGITLAIMLAKEGCIVYLICKPSIHSTLKNAKYISTCFNGREDRIELGGNILLSTKPCYLSKSITVIATKTFDIAKCIDGFPEVLKSPAILLPQNGYSPETMFNAICQKKLFHFRGALYSGVFFGTAWFDVFDYRLICNIRKLVVGSESNIDYGTQVNPIRSYLSIPGIHFCRSKPEYLAFRATKLIYGGTNLISLLLFLRLGEIFAFKNVLQLFVRRTEEMCAAFRTIGINMDSNRLVAECIELCTGQFCNHLPSIVQDVIKSFSSHEQYRTELDAIDQEILSMFRSMPMTTTQMMVHRCIQLINALNKFPDRRKEIYFHYVANNRQYLANCTMLSNM